MELLSATPVDAAAPVPLPAIMGLVMVRPTVGMPKGADGGGGTNGRPVPVPPTPDLLSSSDDDDDLADTAHASHQSHSDGVCHQQQAPCVKNCHYPVDRGPWTDQYRLTHLIQ